MGWVNTAVVVRQSTAAGVNLDGAAPAGTASMVGGRRIYPVDAAHGGLFSFDPAYSYTVYEVRISSPTATGYEVAVLNEAGDVFVVASATGVIGGVAVDLGDLKLKLCGGDRIRVTTSGVAPADLTGAMSEVVSDIWGSMSNPY